MLANASKSQAQTLIIAEYFKTLHELAGEIVKKILMCVQLICPNIGEGNDEHDFAVVDKEFTAIRITWVRSQ